MFLLLQTAKTESIAQSKTINASSSTREIMSEEEEPPYNPKSIADLIAHEIQEQTLKVANGVASLASQGVLYVAKELVFALSGDVQEADTDSYGRENDIAPRTKLWQQKGGGQKKEKKHKKEKKTKKIKSEVRHAPAVVEERRDEISEPAYHIKDLIHKFDSSTGTTAMPNNWNSGRVVRFSRMNIIRDSTEEDSNLPHQEIFRPRSAAELAYDDSDRFAYLTTDFSRHDNGGVSPIMPFKELHKASKTLLFAEQGIIPAGHQSSRAQTEAYVESFLNGAPEPNVLVSPHINANKTEIDIRTEIEDIQKIIAKFEKELAERRQQKEEKGPTQSTEQGGETKKDPKRAEELLTLIKRLERLSHRHQELKARKGSRQQPQMRELFGADANQMGVMHPPVNTAGVVGREPPI